MYCLPGKPSAEFVCAMEDVLDVYHMPYDAKRPIVCLDETCKQLVGETRQPLSMAPGCPARFHHEYVRNGVANLFMMLEPLTGRCHVRVSQQRTMRDWALTIKELVDIHYPEAETITLVMDNLSTHKPKHDRWLTRHPLVRFHYTPTHASWLNQIECWFSILTRQALRGLRGTSPRDVRRAIDDFTKAGNERAQPFEWTKRIVHPGHLEEKYAELCN